MPAEPWIGGELTDPQLRRAVLGEDAETRPDRLADHALIAVPTGAWLTPRPGAHADMLRLPGLSDAAHARLDFYYRATGASPLGAGLWGGPAGDGTPWSPTGWSPDDWEIARALAHALMALRPHADAETLAARIGPMRARIWSRILARRRAQPPRSDLPDPRTLRLLDQTPAHLGFFRFDTVRVQVPQFDGTLSPPLDREIYVSGDAALVLPYDPVRDTVLLIEQFRFGLWRRGDPQPWSLEPIAGLIDPGETPEDSARREATEEAALTLTQLEKISAGYASPGYSTGFFHMFAALCDLPEQGGHIGGIASESENIRTRLLPFSQALAMAETGDISVAPLQLMLFWLDRHRARLRGSAAP